MDNQTTILGATLLLSFNTAACAKTDTAATDTSASVTVAAPGSPVDRRADSAAILGLDAAWIRNVIAKNVDSHGTMAYDHGTFTATVTPPGGKPSRDTGAYLNVWKKIDGQWKMLAELSTPVAAKN